ncbi:hypothetical protein HanPSC8_Chr02g0059231 [Helianthus annuus]|nr:hypothetical protein HanPSC8_Chr02g0059231 [Helianthus annuus]
MKSAKKSLVVKHYLTRINRDYCGMILCSSSLSMHACLNIEEGIDLVQALVRLGGRI